MLQPDLGSAISTSLLAIPIFLSRPKLLKIGLIASLALVLASPLVWRFVLKDYQKDRVTTFLNPKSDPLNKGYNLIQSQIAIGSGGFWGRGYKKGTQGQLLFLPEKHSDFIFASLAEELGIVGVFTLFLAYYLILKALLNLAFQSSSTSHHLFTLAIVTQIWLQAFINIGMNLGILPVTGIPLPFVSVGGSSLMSLLFSLGIIFSSSSP
jgi:rod shape determining protein RodA